MSYYNNQKPENSLRRAIELQGIQQNEQALDLLHTTLQSKRHRTWSPTYEKIMMTFLDLCISLNKARDAKDGLHQYRNLSQSQAPGSLENVIKYLIAKSEEQCLVAQALVGEVEASATATGDDGKTDTDANNMLLLSGMNADPEQNQRESTLLLPKIKFLWESYRAVLDILKSNSKLEALYHIVAVQALEFCATYKRRTEFRRLCDLLRMHLQNLQKYGGIAAMAKIEEGGKPNSKIRGWEGWTSDSIELHLKTRFTQLESSSTLHLYTEGFRTVEDIFNILQISHSKRRVAGVSAAPKARIMAAYYEKLTTLFWVSENYLFHAFAWYKFYTLCKEHNRAMTEEVKVKQASAVLLSALCIPTLPNKATTLKSDDGSSKITSTAQDDIAKEKTARMATLLGFHTRNPTREALLSELRAKNVLAKVPDYLRDLYRLLEENCNPLELVKRAKPLLDRLREEVGEESETEGMVVGSLSSYVEPLISILLLKLLHALSASYHTISLDHIKNLTDDLGVTFTQVEKAIISAATEKSAAKLHVRIDHRANCLRFGDAVTGTKGRSAQLESDSMRSQLTLLSKQLVSVCNIINPPNQAAIAAERSALYQSVRGAVDQEHEDMLARKKMIEKRKEEVERLAQEKLKAQKKKRLESMANAKAEEERRLAREQQLREKEKHEKIQKEMEMTNKKNLLKAMGQNIDAMTEAEVVAIDAKKLAKEHADKAAKKKDDAERKVREVQKKLDYVVRAIRIEEVPLVKKKYEERVKSERERYRADVTEKAEKARLQWEKDCSEKKDLDSYSLFASMASFESAAMAGRRIAHQIACREEDTHAQQLAIEAKNLRARKRRDDDMKRQKEEIEQLKREEEEKKAEEDRLKREEEKRKRDEEQRKREEERQALQRERDQKKDRGFMAPSSRDLDKATAPAAGGRYVPPSRRGASGSGSRPAWGAAGGGARGGNFGGGRYEGGGDRYGGDRPGRGGDSYGGDRYSRDRDDRPPEPRNNRWS